MSRPTIDQIRAREAGDIPHISPEVIDAAIREGQRLRAEAFARWLHAGALAVRGQISGATLRFRRRRLAG